MSIGEGESSSNQRRHSYVDDGVEVGFFTDVSTCIGCKACEVACKEWNDVPADGNEWTGRSYDNSGSLGASTWRHVKFIERDRGRGQHVPGPMTGELEPAFSWLFMSDVCKHCENAGCLEVCPTGSILRVENGAVFVQDDVCNGCGYCVSGCPFGVIDRRPDPLAGAGGAFKCTFCYDRQIDGLTPACAKVCPTESIQFGPLDELRRRASRRCQELHAGGVDEAHIYDPTNSSVGGIHAFFLLLGRSQDYGLPEAPEVPTVFMRGAWLSALATGSTAILASLLAFGLS